MNAQDRWKLLSRALPHVFGLAAIAVIVAGVWGKWGWEWAAMVGGTPPAAFYVWGEIRSTRGPRNSTAEEP